MPKEKKEKFRFEIFDDQGVVVYRAYVESPTAGLRGAKLESFSAAGAQLQGIDMSGTSMYWAYLFEADMSFANLTDSDMRGATLDQAIFRHANLSGANLGRDSVGGRASIRGTDFTDANLDRTVLSGAVFDDKTKFPKGFDPRKHDLIHVNELPSEDPRKR